MWNLDEYCKLILKSVRLRPLLWKVFIYSLGRCFEKHKRTFSFVEQCRVSSVLKFRDIPDWLKRRKTRRISNCAFCNKDKIVDSF